MIVNIELFKQFIREGLINKYSIIQYRSNLEKLIERENPTCKLTVIDNDQFELAFTSFWHVNEILNYCVNLYGYFPTEVLYKMKYGKPTKIKYKNDSFANVLENMMLTDLTVRFETKFSDICTHVPDYLYHYTLSQKVEKILRMGLITKSNNRVIYHPERVYTFADIDYKTTLLGKLKLNDMNVEYQNQLKNPNAEIKKIEKFKLYTLLKIDLTSHKDIKLYHDPKSAPAGYFTTENIPPALITILETEN